MSTNAVIRLLTLVLAWVHSFPASKHLALLFAEPSWSEAWKGIGGTVAVALYLLPPQWQVRGLVALWNRHRRLLLLFGWLLAAGHAVPALDHLPSFLANPSWADAWRGLGSAIAVLWFVSPLPLQARLLRLLRVSQARPSHERQWRIRKMRALIVTSMGVAVFAAGWGVGCATTAGSGISDNGDDGGSGDAGGDSGTSACLPCVTDKDCSGGAVCSQFGSDIYCAPACPHGTECSSDRACTTVTSVTGDQVDVCVPRGNVCGAMPGPATDGGPSSDGGPNRIDAGSPGTCGTLVGPNGSAQCNSCGTHTCQPNGCYGGWWCNTATSKCQSPPTNCTVSGDGGTGFDGGVIDIDAGGPVTGTIGNGGGTLSRLFFGVVGDTRPASIDDTAGYPTAVITQIYSDLAAANPSPPFIVTTGDYMFASTSGTQASPQLDLYVAARNRYAGVSFPTMGNHECTGATASNCGPGSVNGTTYNYSTYLAKMLVPIGKTSPYYRIDVSAANSAWTAKFLFVAANAWDSAQASWLQTQMAQATTYTFIVRHEPSAVTTAPGVSPSEQIMSQYPYTLAIVGHSHTYGRTGTKQVTIGNGGAPLTGGVNYGFGLVDQRTDGSIQVDVIDYSTGRPDLNFRFAVKPDGSPAP